MRSATKGLLAYCGLSVSSVSVFYTCEIISMQTSSFLNTRHCPTSSPVCACPYFHSIDMIQSPFTFGPKRFSNTMPHLQLSWRWKSQKGETRCDENFMYPVSIILFVIRPSEFSCFVHARELDVHVIVVGALVDLPIRSIFDAFQDLGYLISCGIQAHCKVTILAALSSSPSPSMLFAWLT